MCKNQTNPFDLFERKRARRRERERERNYINCEHFIVLRFFRFKAPCARACALVCVVPLRILFISSRWFFFSRCNFTSNAGEMHTKANNTGCNGNLVCQHTRWSNRPHHHASKRQLVLYIVHILLSYKKIVIH